MSASVDDPALRLAEGAAWRLPLRLPTRRLWAGLATVALHVAVMALVLSDPVSYTRHAAGAQNIALIMPLPAQQVPERLVPVDAASLQWRSSVRPLPPPLEPVSLSQDAERESPVAAPSAAAPLVAEARAQPAPVVAAERPQGEDDIAAAYAQRLWTHIRAHRPAGLQLQGTAEVAFRVDRKGSLVWARLIRSSGVALLDRLALRTVREASPFPAPPQQLSDARLEFTAPVNFL